MLDSSDPPTLTSGTQWSLDLLESLDWHLLLELVKCLLHRAGHLPEIAWIRPDGSAALTLVHPSHPGRLAALVQCAPWLHEPISADSLQTFHNVVQNEAAQRGIFVTPGLFNEEARAFARLTKLELVDGSDLLSTLELLSAEESTSLLKMATVGLYTTPSCPSCVSKMDLIADSTSALEQRHRDVVYQDRQVESTELDCQSLTLKKNADVTFLKSVITSSMTVHGKATGHIMVNGRLHVAPGGSVNGCVSARAIQLDPGGSLEAEARILSATEVARLRPIPVSKIWRCPHYPKCRVTLPVR